MYFSYIIGRMSHRIHGIFTYIYNKNQPLINVGKYTGPTDLMGVCIYLYSFVNKYKRISIYMFHTFLYHEIPHF